MAGKTTLMRAVRNSRPGPNGIIVKAVVETEAEREEKSRSLLHVEVRQGAKTDEFVVTTPIAAPAQQVYSLIDWADDRNRFRQMGDSVTALDTSGERFRLVIRYMPDLAFDYEVTEASTAKLYAFRCVPAPSVGYLEQSHEVYRIEAVDEGHCVVTYSTTPTFEAGLDDELCAEVKRNMTIACHNGVAKLKAAAEHGVGTEAAFNATHLMSL